MEDFTEKYTTVTNHLHPEQGDKFETYGTDLAVIKSFANVRTKQVWTVVGSDSSDDVYVIAGFHLVNRIYYLITNEEWQDADEQYEL